jgi:hypothetical protein
VDDAGPLRGGVARSKLTGGLLCAAAARAGNALEALDISDCGHNVDWNERWYDALLAVLAANADTLRELRCGAVCDGVTLDAMLATAPRLRTLHLDTLECALAHVAALHDEARFAPLRVRRLHVQHWRGEDGIEEEEDITAAVLAFAAQLSRADFMPSLTELSWDVLLRPAALDAVVDAALARELPSLQFCECELEPGCAPTLARLLHAGGALTSLTLCDEQTMLDEGALVTLAAAFRANSTLTALSLRDMSLWHSPTPEAAVPLIQALTGHPSLRTLQLRAFVSYGDDADQATAGAALGALLAANAPALTALDISGVELWTAGHTPLFRGLAANTHLRTLRCDWTGVSAAFAADVLLPCVRAATGLRELDAHMQMTYIVERGDLQAAVNLVHARPLPGGGVRTRPPADVLGLYPLPGQATAVLARITALSSDAQC